MVSMFHKQNKSLKNSYSTGVFACMMTGLTEEFFTPFLLLLGGTSRHVGILKAAYHIFASIIQLSSTNLSIRFKSRKRVVSIFTSLQMITLMIMASLAFMQKGHPIIFIILVAIFSVCGALIHPCWVSLLADLVPTQRRGEYFGWRGRNLGMITVSSGFLAGIVLHYMERLNTFYGFSIIFFVAAVSRLISRFFLNHIDEPPVTQSKEDYFSLFQFFARLRSSNFAKFTMFVGAMNFSVNLAAPYFAVFMLKDLKFNYFIYTLINVAAPLTLYMMIRRWGKHADKVGNIKIIKLVTPLIGCIPLLWILNQNPIFLIIAEMFSGFLWAGFNLCTSNFIIDAVSPGKRTRCIAYFSLVNGLALASGALIGGFLINKLPTLFGYKILTLFLISSIFRLCVALIVPRKLKEVRQVEEVSRQQLLFSMIGVRPIFGIDRKTIQV